MNKPKAAAPNPKLLRLTHGPGQTPEESTAAAAVAPSVNAAAVVDSFQRNIMGDDVNLTALVISLQTATAKVNGGDLSTLEGMLVGQATALQSIFTSLAKRAVHQEGMGNYVSFLTLALKAQAQSRATISALVDLKHPRQVAFVNQANISNGPQQVNNGSFDPGDLRSARTRTRAREKQNQANELLESHHDNTLDEGTSGTAGSAHQNLATVGAVNRPKNRGR